MVYEDVFECADVVLLVEKQHGFFVIDAVNGSERKRTIAVGDEDGVAGYACRALVAVGKGLYVTQEDEGQQGFFRAKRLAKEAKKSYQKISKERRVRRRAEGETKKAVEIARNFKKQGIPVKMIAVCMKLSVEEIINLGDN